MAAKAAAAAKSRSTPAKKQAATKSSAKKPSATGKRAVAKKAATAKKPAAKKARSRKVATVKGNVVTPIAWGPAQRTDELAKALGGVTALAKALGVSPSQPSRWKSGKESPGDEAARKLIDLDHVVARAMLVWDPEVVPIWLRSSNGFLGGQTPLGVLMTRGPAEVLVALDAYESGGFA